MPSEKQVMSITTGSMLRFVLVVIGVFFVYLFRNLVGALLVSILLALAIEPISETEFDMPFTDGRFTFRKDDQGRVSGVHFRIGDGERDMKRVAP